MDKYAEIEEILDKHEEIALDEHMRCCAILNNEGRNQRVFARMVGASWQIQLIDKLKLEIYKVFKNDK